jgi:UDP-glucose 4-epimerase
MKALVTGGAGFIGHHLVKRLLADGHEVTVIDNLSTGLFENIEDLDCRFVEAYIESVDYDALTIEHDVLFHLAAPVSVEESLRDPGKYYSEIALASNSLIEWSINQGCKTIVIASTAAVYGASEDIPFGEDSPLKPMSPYAKAKLMTEHVLEDHLQVSEINGTALRFFNVYGEGQRDEGGYLSAVPIFLNQYESFKPITVTGDGQQTRDWVYVGDVVEACILAAEKAEGFNVYNVGSGQETSVMDLAEAFGGEIAHIEKRNEPKCSQANITNIVRDLEWTPKTNLLSWIKMVK